MVSGHVLPLLAISIMVALVSVSGMPVTMHGVDREQVIEYDHIDYHRVANEFDLIEPSSISVHYSEDDGSEYLNTDSFLRGSSASSGVRRLVVDPDTHPLAAGTTYTIEVVNGTDSPLGISNHDNIEALILRCHKRVTDPPIPRPMLTSPRACLSSGRMRM